MDVLKAKHIRFAPVVLYMPGHEPKEKKFLKHDPEMWKIFQRLSRNPGQQMKPDTPIQCGYAPPTFAIPGKEGMRCMCYEQLMSIIKEQSFIQPPKIYRCAKGKPRYPSDSVFPTWPKKAMLAFRQNEELQFPLGTVIVRWQQKRFLPMYNKDALRSIFERFGPVTDIRPLGTNSCLVIFEEVMSACNVMQARHLGQSTNQLHCTWWHKAMANKMVAVREKGVVVQTNLYLV